MNRIPYLAALAGLALTFGCNGDKNDDSGLTETDADTDADSDADSDADTDADTDADIISFTLEGSTFDVLTQGAAAEGLCISAINPDPAVSGGDPITMATATLDASGNFSIAGVDAKPSFGILMSITDCAEEGTVIATATPVPAPSYADLVEGDTLSGLTAFSINVTYAGYIDGSLAAAGYSGTGIEADGALAGFIVDNTLTPIDGATVTGAASVYYQDADSTDGLFTTGTDVNAATVAMGGSMFFVPQAGVGAYSASASGYSFPTYTLGSSPGSVVFAPLVAE